MALVISREEANMTEDRIGVDQPSAFSKTAIQMLLGALLIAASTPALSQQAAPKREFQPPTATELFKLRGTCVKLGQELLDGRISTQLRLDQQNHIAGAPPSMSAIARYNPADGYCYVDYRMGVPRDWTTNSRRARAGQSEMPV